MQQKLKNRYFIIRHGESKANVAQIISSSLEDGKKEDYTLTTQGEAQVQKSVTTAKKQGLLNEQTVIVSSPFSRAKKTAEIVKEVLGVKTDIVFDDRLRERWFGDFEKQHNRNYEKVWTGDKENPTHTDHGVESAKAVQERTASLVEDLEETYHGKSILLVSHGDALQILQTWFLGKSAREHRALPHLETAEVRELKQYD